MEFLKLFLSQDKTFKLSIRIAYILLGLFSSIWIAEKVGYPLQAPTLNLEAIIKLFSDYTLLLGVTIYILTTEAITIVSGVGQWLVTLVYQWTLKGVTFKRKFSTGTGILALHNQVTENDKEPTKRNLAFHESGLKMIRKDFVQIRQLIYVLISFGICYDFVIRDKFPNAHFWIVSVVIWLLYFCLLFLNSIGTAIISSTQRVITILKLKSQAQQEKQ